MNAHELLVCSRIPWYVASGARAEASFSDPCSTEIGIWGGGGLCVGCSNVVVFASGDTWSAGAQAMPMLAMSFS